MSPELLQAAERIGGLFIALVVLWGVYRIVKHLIDKLAKPLVDAMTGGLGQVQKTQEAQTGLLNAMSDSLIEIKAAEANEAEERRYMRANFEMLLTNQTKLVQAFSTFRGENVFRDETISEIHTMSTDIHRETVNRPTGVHRREEIERKHRERESR